MTTRASAAQVLLVEDDTSLAEAIVHVLAEASISTVVAKSVAEAKLHNLRSYSVVLLDIKLPGQSGVAFLEYLSKQHIVAKVIVVTNMSDDTLFAKVRAHGVCDYIIKSNISLKGVREKVIQVIESGSCLQPFDCVQYNGE